MSKNCKCGGFRCIQSYSDKGEMRYRVFCTKCGRQTSTHETQEGAIKEWESVVQRRPLSQS